MPGSLTAAPVSPRSLTAAVNAMTAKVGAWPGSNVYPGATLFPGFIWGAGVVSALQIVAVGGTLPPFFPGASVYPGRGTTLGATPIT